MRREEKKVAFFLLPPTGKKKGGLYTNPDVKYLKKSQRAEHERLILGSLYNSRYFDSDEQ